MSGVGEPFLSQDVRYHCPVFAILKFHKPIARSFKRLIWRYDKGYYDQLRQDISSVSWNDVILQSIAKHGVKVNVLAPQP